MIAGIKTMEAANQYLKEIFVPWHNQSLVKGATDPHSTAFTPILPQVDLDLIFSVQTKRQVNADNTVQYKRASVSLSMNT
jgi:hypothetical protein